MTKDTTGSLAITPAKLDNPFYYLINARQVIEWNLTYYRDLLQSDEVALLENLLKLPEKAQGLLMRLIMRQGDLFRSDSLKYVEVGSEQDLSDTLYLLEKNNYLDLTPEVSLPELVQLCRKSEALALLNSCHDCAKDQEFSLSARQSKQQLLAFAESISAQLADKNGCRKLSVWWPKSPFRLIKLGCRSLFERLQLMFFGNLYQSWSEFVLTELGIQRYEEVALSPESRAFSARQEVDIYLTLHRIQKQLDALKLQKGSETLSVSLEKMLHELHQLQPKSEKKQSDTHSLGSMPSQWLQRRYDKTSFSLGHFAERNGHYKLALSCYRNSQGEDAVIRRFRLLEKICLSDTEFEALYRELQTALENTVKPEQKVLLNRIVKRVGRKLNKRVKSKKKSCLSEQVIWLYPHPTRSVEGLLVDHLADQGETAFHVESRLINGLFGLLFWPAIFEPVPGAFFNPFQSAPSDLYRSEFYRSRQQQIEAIFDRLGPSGAYKEDILNTYHKKKGISCSLLHWATLNETLLNLSLELIPASHLEVLFRHLLLDLRHHRKGLPDLVVFNRENNRYRFVEVKAPGDRLQDHQRLWLEQMAKDNIPAEVVYVRWRDS